MIDRDIITAAIIEYWEPADPPPPGRAERLYDAVCDRIPYFDDAIILGATLAILVALVCRMAEQVS